MPSGGVWSSSSDELADVRPREASPQEADEHRDRQQDLTGDLPPVQAGGDELRQAREQVSAVSVSARSPATTAARRSGARMRRMRTECPRELPDHERDEDRGEDAVAAEHERPVELVGDARLCVQEHEALRAGRDVAKPLAVVDEQRRERQHRARTAYAAGDERALEPVGDPAGRIRERHVPEERDVELAQRVSEREHERVVGVLPRTDRGRRARTRSAAARAG